MSRSIFITATDTHAGKTWVTSSLLKTSLAQGLDVQALKPIASGLNADGCNEDVAVLLVGQANKRVQDINFVTYDLPLAPALAAQKQQSHIQPDALKHWLAQQSEKHDITLIEGVGGLMVPLSVNEGKHWLVSDWLKTIPDVEVMLVVPLQLGCMNQALLSYQHLQSIGLPPQWLVFNDMAQTDSYQETKNILEPILQNMLGKVPEMMCLSKDGEMSQLF